MGCFEDFREGLRAHLVDARLHDAHRVLAQSFDGLAVGDGRVEEGEGFGVLALDFPRVVHDVADHCRAHFLVVDDETVLAFHDGFQHLAEARGLLFGHAISFHS